MRLSPIAVVALLTACASTPPRNPRADAEQRVVRDVRTDAPQRGPDGPTPTTSLANIVIPATRHDPQECAAFQASLPAEIKRGYVTTNESKIFYYGKWTKRPLIIANGGPGGSSWSTYKVLAPALGKENVEYLFFDQKGTGCSSPLPPLDEEHFPQWRNYNAAGHAADIDLLRQRLNLGSKITVFGASFGSKIALSYAIQFPKTTRAILFYGDTFVASETEIVKGVIGSLQRRQDFLDQRLVANPRLEATLKSLARKYATKPCATDEANLISACGYDLIRDLGHYYTDSNAEKIESLLNRMDDPASADEALRETILEYTSWKLDPATVLLGHMDYRNTIKGEQVCDIALTKFPIADWQLNSCIMGKYRAGFIDKISKHIQPTLISAETILEALRTHPSVKAYALESHGDLSSNDKPALSHPPNWIAVDLPGADHHSYYATPKFWGVVRMALN